MKERNGSTKNTCNVSLYDRHTDSVWERDRERQTDRQTDRQAGRRTDGQTDGQTEISNLYRAWVYADECQLDKYHSDGNTLNSGVKIRSTIASISLSSAICSRFTFKLINIYPNIRNISNETKNTLSAVVSRGKERNSNDLLQTYQQERS